MKSKKIKCPKCQNINPSILNYSIDNNSNIKFILKCICSNRPIECKLGQFLIDSNTNFENLYENNMNKYIEIIERFNSIKNYLNLNIEQIITNINLLIEFFLQLSKDLKEKKKEYYTMLDNYKLFINSLFNTEKNLSNIEKIKIANETISFFPIERISYFINKLVSETSLYKSIIKTASLNQSLLFEFNNDNLYNKSEYTYHNLTVYDIIECKSINKIASCSSDHKLNLYNKDDNFSLYKTIITGLRNVKLFEIKKKKKIVCTTLSSKIFIYSLITFEKILTINCHDNIVWDFIKLTNGCFASCGADRNINVYNNHLTHVKYSLKEHKTPIRHILEFKKNLLLSCSWDGKILFWDLIQKKNVNELDCKTCVYDMVKISQNELAVCSKNCKISIWNINNGEIIKSKNIENSIKIWSFCLRNDNNINNGLIYCACKNSKMVIITQETLDNIISIKIPCENPKKILVSDGKIIIGCRNGKIFIYSQKQ